MQPAIIHHQQRLKLHFRY